MPANKNEMYFARVDFISILYASPHTRHRPSTVLVVSKHIYYDRN